MRSETKILALTWLIMLMAYPAACQSSAGFQLGFILDGSGSINTSDFNLMINGLADIVQGSSFPKDGSVEITIVQIGVDVGGTPGARVEIDPVIVTAANAASVANSIRGIVQGQGSTPLACGFLSVADAIAGSPNFDPNAKQIINIITDGSPNVCCDNPGIFVGNACNQSTDPQASTVNARDYSINKLAMTPDQDRITCEFVGNDLILRDWLRDQIVWPQPGSIAPPYPSSSGWVRMIASFQELKEAIDEKIRIITPQPVTRGVDTNFDSVKAGNDKATAFGQGLVYSKLQEKTEAANELIILKVQNAGDCRCCQMNNSSELCCDDCCHKQNYERIRAGDRNAFGFGNSKAKNSVKIVTNQA